MAVQVFKLIFLTLFRLTPKDVSEQQVFELLLLNRTFDVSLIDITFSLYFQHLVDRYYTEW